MVRRLFHLFTLLVLLVSISNAQLENVVNEWKSDPDLKSALNSFCVIDLGKDEVVSEYNSHYFMIPASTMKVVTTAAGLGLLGNNYRYETKIYLTGKFDKATGVVDGDLIIVGQGDPSLQSEYFSRDTVQITNKWAGILKEKGIKEIKGRIIGDATYFDRSVPGNWIWADISNYFGTVPCALSYNDNKFKVIYCTKESGCKADVIKTQPAYLSKTITINSSVIGKGSEDEAYVSGDPFSFIKDINGKIPPNKSNYDIEAALPDPALLCAEMLYTSLTRIGVKCDINKIESRYQKPDSVVPKTLLYTHYSPTLDKIVFHTNLRSNNHYCETILRTIGKGSMYTGIEQVKKYWQSKGLDISELFMSDGSGLSRSNGISTSFQAQLLKVVYKDSLLYKAFNNSLPIAGKSGSMSNIGKGTFIENNMRAKTGYINRARGYCGYVRTKKGKDLAFSVLLNNYNCSAKEAKIKIEKFLIALGEL